jgi:L-alanine-DL-glutamate epimerase-like enolase superfamily enzyme
MDKIALAGGENFRGEEAFAAAIESTVYRFVQPDIAKWGGLSGNLDVVRKIHDNGLTYCPHWLGGGVGLMASAHLLAAAGGNGLLEVDANPNPLRDELLRTRDDKPLFDSDDQTRCWQPRNDAGNGVQLDQNVIERYSVFDWQSA